MINIEEVSGPGSYEYLEYLKKNPNSLFYSCPSFIKIISENLSSTPVWLIARKNGNISGVLPFIKKDGPLGPVFNSMAYYGSNGGVIQHNMDEESKKTLIQSFYKLAESEDACSATIITNPLEKDWKFYDKYTVYDFLDERIGQITHFSSLKNTDDLINFFDDPRPRNIRRAIKEGVEIERTQSKEAIDFLFTTHVREMEAKGGLAKERNFFDLFPKYLDDDSWAIYMAKLDGEPIAALLLFYFNETVEYFTPVIVYELRKTQASSLVIYEAMIDAMNLGYKNWNWGGTWLSQKGVYDFKKKWNANEYPYFYYVRVFNDKLKKKTPEYLLSNYPGFYLIPYSGLE